MSSNRQSSSKFDAQGYAMASAKRSSAQGSGMIASNKRESTNTGAGGRANKAPTNRRLDAIKEESRLEKDKYAVVKTSGPSKGGQSRGGDNYAVVPFNAANQAVVARNNTNQHLMVPQQAVEPMSSRHTTQHNHISIREQKGRRVPLQELLAAQSLGMKDLNFGISERSGRQWVEFPYGTVDNFPPGDLYDFNGVLAWQICEGCLKREEGGEIVSHRGNGSRKHRD
jgi:hypothetical protein